MQLFRCSLQHAVIFLSRINAIVPMQSATRSNISVAPLSSNSSSSLFYSTPLINHLSLPTNSNSSASSGSNVHHLSNGKSSKHHGGYCAYSDYKSNVTRCGLFIDHLFSLCLRCRILVHIL